MKQKRKEYRSFLSIAAAFTALCILALFSVTAWGDGKIGNSFSILKNGLQDGNSTKAQWKQPVTLQVVTSLPSDNSELHFEISVPSEGITAQLQDNSSDLPTKLRWTEPLEIAGIPASSIPGISIRSNGGNPIFTGGSGKDFEVWLTKDSYSYIEKNGFAPATSSADQSSTAGIKAGGQIALTFQIMLNDAATQNNVLSSMVYVGRQASDQESVTIESTTGNLPLQPVVTQAVLIDGRVDPRIVSNPNVFPNTATFARDGNPDSLKVNEKVYIQAQTQLPNPSLMSGAYSNFSFKIQPSAGLTVISSYEIAGIECKDLPSGCKISGTQDSSGTLVGNNKVFNEITLTSQDITYIESHGLSPATSDKEASKPKSLSPGDEFAIAFQAYANAEIAQVFNNVQVIYSGPTGNISLSSSVSTLVINIATGKTYKIDDTEKESRLEVLDSSGLVTSNTYFPENKWIKMQVLVTMPTPTTLRYPHTLAITVEASNGINLDFQYGSEYYSSQPNIKIAGLIWASLVEKSNYTPQLQNVALDSSGNPEPNIKTYTLSIPGDVLQDSVEPQGLSPATTTSPQGQYPEGISPGGKFAVTFYVEMNNQAVEDNPVTVKVGEMPFASNNALTANWTNTPYQVQTVLHPVPDGNLQIVKSSGTTASQIYATPVPSALPPSSSVENSFKLQLSTTLIKGVSSMEFFIDPSEGVTVDDQIAKGEVEVGGIPASELPDPLQVTSNPQDVALGQKDPPLEFKIDSTDLAYINSHGASPATTSNPQGKNTGVEYGSDFALTIWGYLNEKAVITPNNVTGWIVTGLNNSSYTTDKTTVNLVRTSPINVETHFIKNGYYQTREMSGWGVASEGVHETLQISITMPTEEEIQAYKRMTIEVQPEKGVTAMSWAPCQVGCINYNVDNWNDIYLAGSNLWSWQNHGVLYTIYPYEGNEWITGGSKESWNVALGIPELNYIQQSGQLAATTTHPPTWASGVKPGEQFSLKLPVYLNSDSTETGNLVKVTVFWGQNAQNGMAKTTYFDIVKNAADLPSPLPFTGGSKVGPIVVLSLSLLTCSLMGVIFYKRKKRE